MNSVVCRLFFFIISISLNSATIYHNLVELCGGKRHVLCEQPGIGPQCTSYRSDMNITVKAQILSEVNRLRNEWASRLLNDAVNRMKFVDWDPELSEIAQRWTDQCQIKDPPCYNIGRFEPGLMSYFGPVNDSVLKPVEAWASEMNLVQQMNSSQSELKKVLSNFTQLTSAPAHYIGCGSAIFLWNRREIRYTVCLIGPKEEKNETEPKPDCVRPRFYPHLCLDTNGLKTQVFGIIKTPIITRQICEPIRNSANALASTSLLYYYLYHNRSYTNPRDPSSSHWTCYSLSSFFLPLLTVMIYYVIITVLMPNYSREND